MNDFLLDIDEDDDYKPIRCPFVWPGGKSKAVDKICPHLPVFDTYVEPFGGSGAVLLARKPSKLEVYNDRYTGVVAFYRCLRDPAKFDKLMDRLRLSLHSREDWVFCKETWEQCKDDVERAARWYTMVEYSFGGIGRNWGKSLAPRSNIARKLHRKLPTFQAVHDRLSGVQIENCDYMTMLRDYDSLRTVFYLDPPYVGTDVRVYDSCAWGRKEQLDLLKAVFELDGFVAVSGYEDKVTDSFPWDDKITWRQSVSIKSTDLGARGHATECLWIKEAYTQ